MSQGNCSNIALIFFQNLPCGTRWSCYSPHWSWGYYMQHHQASVQCQFCLWHVCGNGDFVHIFSQSPLFYSLSNKVTFFSYGKFHTQSRENNAIWFHVPITHLEKFSTLCLSAMTFVNIIIIICISWPWLVFQCPFTFCSNYRFKLRLLHNEGKFIQTI